MLYSPTTLFQMYYIQKLSMLIGSCCAGISLCCAIFNDLGLNVLVLMCNPCFAMLKPLYVYNNMRNVFLDNSYKSIWGFGQKFHSLLIYLAIGTFYVDLQILKSHYNKIQVKLMFFLIIYRGGKRVLLSSKVTFQLSQSVEFFLFL